MFEPFQQFRKHILHLQNWPSYEDLYNLTLLKGQKIKTYSSKDIDFVPLPAKKIGLHSCYETGIYLTGEIPTRLSNWHDFFNAMVWRTFPSTKAALNYLHYEAIQIALSQNSGQRGRLRDALTLLDESGVIVISSSDELIDLLKNFYWEELFWKKRSDILSAGMRFYIFGHGLYEKALNPYIGMTGKGLCFRVTGAFFAQTVPEQLKMVDTMLQTFLLKGLLRNVDLTPVPLLGYPDWDINNNIVEYYRNTRYFRLGSTRALN